MLHLAAVASAAAVHTQLPVTVHGTTRTQQEGGTPPPAAAVRAICSTPAPRAQASACFPARKTTTNIYAAPGARPQLCMAFRLSSAGRSQRRSAGGRALGISENTLRALMCAHAYPPPLMVGVDADVAAREPDRMPTRNFHWAQVKTASSRKHRVRARHPPNLSSRLLDVAAKRQFLCACHRSSIILTQIN